MAWTELVVQAGFNTGPHRALLPFLLLMFLTSRCLGGPTKPARISLSPGQPFLVLWGVANKAGSGRPDPGAIGMEREGCLAMFYEDTLGKYPYYTDQDQPVNGGLPQQLRPEGHLQNTQEDLAAALPSPGYRGTREWGYWVGASVPSSGEGTVRNKASTWRALLRTFFPNWTTEEVEKWSQVRSSSRQCQFIVIG